MENYQGDLADILRANSGAHVGSTSSMASGTTGTQPHHHQPDSIPTSWHFQTHPTMDQDFGYPFCDVPGSDPLLHDLDIPGPGLMSISSSTNNNDHSHHLLPLHGTQMKSPANNNSFSRMLQISPGAKMPAAPNSSKSLVENPALQISSPRNAGIKRRKSQAKRVVCVPAPAPANGRSTGEVVPSDLWAWRKYGQKPIKGSPYPRGYYRCSSSKGCSARKQVERSRTDPNMLVITYTSEHNHPWPTQRNALAGSTRSQTPKSNPNPKIPQDSSKSESKESEQPQINETTTHNIHSDNKGQSVKEEQIDHNRTENTSNDDGFAETYKPDLPAYKSVPNHPEDFFADLGELEGDPLSLLFTHGFSGDEGSDGKALDPLSFYDWPTNHTTSLGQAKGGSS